MKEQKNLCLTCNKVIANNKLTECDRCPFCNSDDIIKVGMNDEEMIEYNNNTDKMIVIKSQNDDRNVLLCQSCNEIFTGFFKNCPFCNSPYLTSKEEDLPILPALDLQLFAGGFTQQAPSHILYTQESEEYIVRSFFDRPGHNCKNGYPSYVRQSGKNQEFAYIAGPFWSKKAASDILGLADWLIQEYHTEGYGEGTSPVSLPCNLPDTEYCNSFLLTGKEHDADCKGGKHEKVWQSCKKHDGMMKKLKDILEAKGFKLYKDWWEFGTSQQKMIYWLERQPVFRQRRSSRSPLCPLQSFGVTGPVQRIEKNMNGGK